MRRLDRRAVVGALCFSCLIPVRSVSAGEGPTASGMTVHVDPQTGKLLPQPPSVVSPRRAAAAPVLEEKSAAKPGGGVTVDLRGQFQHSLQVEAGSDGALQPHCDPAPPAPAED